MELLRTPLLIYFIIISVVAIVATAYDKSAAWKRAWRVPERTLLWIGALGGALFMFIVMKLIRHKTRHGKYMIPLPIFILLHAIIAYFVYVY